MQSKSILVIHAHRAHSAYFLMAKEDVGERTQANCERRKLKLASRRRVDDALLRRKFATKGLARSAAEKAGFRAHTYQEITARTRTR